MKVLFAGPFSNYGIRDGGYGNAAAGIAQCLSRMETEQTIDELSLVSTLDPKNVELPAAMHDVGILVTNPYSLLREESRKVCEVILNRCRRRYLSVVWETFPLPAVWDMIWKDDLFTGFLAPSYFVGTQIVRHTDKPVYYYPHFINSDHFPPIRKQDKEIEDVFTVLFMGQNTMRKGVTDACTAFGRALGENKDCRLIVKSHSLSEREVPIEKLVYHTVLSNTRKPQAQVYVTTEMLEGKELADLYRTSSVLLFPSRGEGFGLPPAEATCCGLPVIYTSWSSLPEVCNAPGNTPVPFYLDEAHGMMHHGYERNSVYAVPSVHTLCKTLYKHYLMWKENKHKYYDSAKAGREWIEERFGYERISKYLEHIIREGKSFAPEELYDKETFDELTETWDNLEKSIAGAG